MINNSSKRPIAFFIPALNGGGAQRVVVNLANSLLDITDHPIHVVLLRREGEFLDELRPAVNIVDLGTRRASLSVFALARYMRRERPRSMLSTLGYANIVFIISGLLAQRPCRLVVREANVVRKPTGKWIDKFRSRIIIGLMRMLYPCADAVVAICNDVLQSMQAAGVNIHNRTVVIGNPIDLMPPALTSNPMDYLPKPCPPFICSIGRLSESKGFDILLSAFSKVQDTHLNLVILGEGPLRNLLVRQARTLGIEDRVHMPGFVKNPRKILQKAELFVLSSRWEGFVNVLLEALATGVPVVSTDCPGSPNDILEGGAHGRLVPYDDPEALAAAIIKELEVPSGTREGRMARAKDFSAEKIARQYLEQVL